MKAPAAALWIGLLLAPGCGVPESTPPPEPEAEDLSRPVERKDGWPRLTGQLECLFEIAEDVAPCAATLQVHPNGFITDGDAVLARPTDCSLVMLLGWLRKVARDMPRGIVTVPGHIEGTVELDVPQGSIALYVAPEAPFEIAGAVVALCSSDAVRIGEIRLVCGLDPADPERQEIFLRQWYCTWYDGNVLCIDLRPQTAEDGARSERPDLDRLTYDFDSHIAPDLQAAREFLTPWPWRRNPSLGARLRTHAAISSEELFHVLQLVAPIQKIALVFRWRGWELPALSRRKDTLAWRWPRYSFGGPRLYWQEEVKGEADFLRYR